MAGRKKLFHNYAIEHCIKIPQETGITIFSFVDLQNEYIPKNLDIGRFVYSAYDVFYKTFIPYKIKGYEIRDEMLCFIVNDWYRVVDEGHVKESLGAIRTFYQSDVILIPNEYLVKKHRTS